MTKMSGVECWAFFILFYTIMINNSVNVCSIGLTKICSMVKWNQGMRT